MPVNFRSRLQGAARLLITGRLPVEKRRDIPPITPQEVAEVKLFFRRPKFFIFGHARSGTTLLARLVRVHPQVHCNYQAHFFTRSPLLESLVADQEVGAWLSRRSNRWNRGRDLSPLVLRAAADIIMEREAHIEGKEIVGDKSPSSLLDGKAVELLYKVYPDAFLIYIVRDGRDTLISHRFQAFIDNPHTLAKEDLKIRQAFSENPGPFLRGERSLFTPQGLRIGAQGWVKNVEETDRLGQRLYGERYLSLRYEDLLEKPADEMRRVWTFLGAQPNFPDLEGKIAREIESNPDADWQNQKASEIAQPLQKGKQGSWRQMFTQQDRQIFKEIAGQALISWNYEQGMDW